MSLDSARVQVSSASTPAKTNGGFHGQVQEVCNATPAKPVHATSYAPKSRLGELDICLRDAIPHRAGPKFRQLDSFTDWIPRTVPDVHIHDQPAMAPELRAELPLQPSLPLIASLESFWDRFGDDPMQHVVEQTAAIPMEEAASATKIAPPLAIANARNTPVRKPALNIVLGEDVNDPDSLFLDSEVSLQDHMLQDVVYIMDDPASNTYIPPTDHMIRLSVKMYDKTPDKLTLDMRDKVETLFPNCHLVDGYLQKGCTHLVVDLSIPSGYASALVHPQGLAKALKGGPLATELPEDHFLSGQGVIQGPGGTAVRVSSGRIVAEASARRAAPFLLGANTPVVCSDGNCDCGSTSVTLYAVHDTSSAPISRLSVAVRQAGSFIDASLEEAASLCAAPAFGPEAVIVRLRVRLSCDDLAEGLVLIEVSNAGVLSDPLPIVSTSDALIVKELAALGHAKPLTSSEPSLDARLVADLGLILDGFASANLARGALARYGEGSEALASHKARMASRSRSVLLSAAERGWVAVAAAVLEAADADCQTVTEAVTKVDALRPNGPGLLHAAIRGRNPVLLSLILDWAAESGCVLDVTSPWGGVSPLHLSAAMDDGGGMAELLLQHAAPGDLETQRMLWGDTNGRHLSPEAVAKRCSRQTTVSGMALKRPLVGGGESAAAAERQTASRSAMRPPLAPPLPSRPDREASSKISDSPQGNLLAKARNMWNTGRKQFVDRRHSSPTLDKLDSAKSYMDLSDQGEPSPPPGLDEQVPWEEVETLGLDASAESFVAPLPAMNDVPRSPCVPRTDSARDESANYPPPKVGDSGSVTGPEVCDSMRQGKQQLGIPKPLGDRM